MLTLRPSGERGSADHGWLQSRHSFSFASYHDPDHMQFGPLRVINEDWIAPGTGFGTHGHRDMEIITYVLAGAITHQDSLGNASVIRAGNVQRMSAGTGVMHSEHNRDSTLTTHMLQIWILPSAPGGEPGYEEKPMDEPARNGRLALIASPNGEHGSLTVRQDMRLWAGRFDSGQSGELSLVSGRRVYVHLARGALEVNGVRLATGDAVRITDESLVRLDRGNAAEVLVFDLP